jgi:hypothetical protein
MTSNEFLHWLRGFIDYQQLQGNTNPAFNTINNRLDEVSDVVKSKTYKVKASDSMNVSNSGNFETNQSVTYKTDTPITYTSE